MMSVLITCAAFLAGVAALAYAAVRAGAEADRLAHGSSRLLLRRSALVPAWKGTGWYLRTPGPRTRPGGRSGRQTGG